MVVVAGGVLAPSRKQRVVLHHAADVVEPFGIGSIGAFLVVGESVEADVLQLARTAGGSKSIGLSGLHGNLTPLRLFEARRAVDGHTALVELLAVAEYILGYLAQIQVELAAVLRGGAFLARIDIRIEEPELHIFDVGLLEVGGL